jgi:phosphatidylglycerophosphatase C
MAMTDSPTTFTRSNTGQSGDARPVAAFDVDGTLTWTDSFMLFLRFVSGRWGFVARMIGLVPVFLAYLVRLRSRDATKNLLMKAFLAGMSQARYDRWCQDFARVAYPIIIRPDAMARLNSHLGVRDDVALVSASLEGYLTPWAQTLGVETVLATQVEVRDGMLTGAMAGQNCRCEQKLARIKAQFGDAPLVAAYGDSRGDEEMLEACQNPGYRVFEEAPANRRAIWWDLYFGDLLERRTRGDMF